MFESLSEKLEAAFRSIRGRGTLREKDVDDALREVRMALLEADVHYRVARDFCASIREKAVGGELSRALTPSQQIVKMVNEQLVELLGSDESEIHFASAPPTVVLLCGLQGSGKTTTAGKLANFFRSKGRRPLLVATDIHRPAAIAQLQVVGDAVGVPVFQKGDRTDAATIARESLKEARSQARDVVIIDTAGRLHTDSEMMDEIRAVATAADPQERLLVLDSLTGQDAVRVAGEFADAVSLSGAILTKLDGDARGGAALSLRAVAGVPIKFAGVGEKYDALEPFHPDRVASRILGMGDMLTLIERAEAAVDKEQAAAMQEKLASGSFDLEDFLQQLQQMKKVGPLQQLMEMLPKGMLGPGAQFRPEDVDPREFGRLEAIVLSMTAEERHNPKMLDGSRKKRIARGSGTSMADVNALIKQFRETQQTMRTMLRGEGPGKKKQKKIRLQSPAQLKGYRRLGR